MWVHLVPLGLIDGASPGNAPPPPPPPQENVAGFLSPEEFKRLRKRTEDEQRAQSDVATAAVAARDAAPIAPSDAALIPTAQQIDALSRSTQGAVIAVAAFIQAQEQAAAQAVERALDDDDMQALALILTIAE